jgi:predicted RNA binding protein with dsRBD fold (UPF0201 family)
MMPNTITFQTTNNTWVMRITADRRIEVNEDVEVTEAAKKVLDAMQHLLTPQRTWQGLTDEERRELWWSIDMSGMLEHDYGKAIEQALKDKNYE